MKEKVFVTDIDSVLIDISTPLENAVNELFDCPEAFGFMHSLVGMWDLNLAFGLNKEQMDAVWDEAFARPNLPYPGAVTFVKELQKNGFYVLGVTKRGGPRFQEPAKRDIPILGLDEYIFADNHQSKGPVLTEWAKANNLEPEQIRYFLDDKIGNIQSVVEYFPHISAFLQNQPWNTSLDIDVDYERVEAYSEILALV